jgi:hypothetical protein
MTTWKTLGVVAPDQLADARRQLHWAVQTVAATADANLEAMHDDGHTSMRWHDPLGALVSHAIGGLRIALRVRTLELVTLDAVGAVAATFALAGRSLDDAMSWAGEHVGGVPRPRDYDMPDHAVRRGARFDADAAALAELERWFANAFALVTELAAAGLPPGPDAMTRNAIPVACWPHHFDVGSIFLLDRKDDGSGDPRGRQIGFGVSPGDHFYEEPYLYVTPHPIPAKAALPPLAVGGAWHRAGFTGAVLTGTTIAAAGAKQHHFARRFFDSAIAAALTVIPTTP